MQRAYSSSYIESKYPSLRKVILNYESAREVLVNAGYAVRTEKLVRGRTEKVIGLSIWCDGILINKEVQRIKNALPGFEITSRNETIFIR